MAGHGGPGRAPRPADALAALAGAVACAAMATLPDAEISGWSAALVVPALCLRGPARWILLFGAGLGWTAWQAQQALDLRMTGTTASAVVEGTVDGLPEPGTRGVRFELVLAQPASAIALQAGARVRLSAWPPLPAPRAGEHLRVEATLRRPTGLVNPGGYDFERQALLRRWSAVGSVRNIEQRDPPPAWSVDAARERLSAQIGMLDRDPAVVGILRALAVGDQAAIPDRAWEVLRNTGTAHLVAISGFHIGLLAGLGALLARGFWRAFPAAALRMARRQAEAAAALACATAYSLLAGASLPVLRTLLMIAVVLATRVARRPVAGAQSLALALLALLAWDPLAVLAPGFWLSFAGVAWLILCLGGRGRGGLLRQFGRAQVVMAIGLTPLTAVFFQQATLVAPLANLVAVPSISLVVLPLLLLGSAWAGIAPSLGFWLIERAADVLLVVWWSLEDLARWPHAVLGLAAPDRWALLSALLGAFILLLPRAVPGRALGLALWLPLLLPRIDRPAPGAFELAVLDVGQGLAVLVRTHGHVLAYDAGPAPSGGVDTGASVVAPTLLALGHRRLDALVVSHGDNDHAGGAPALIAAFAPTRVHAGPGVRLGTVCEAGQAWRWDDVRFEFLHPPAWFPDLGNQSSCILRISGAGGSILLPGDADALIEERLVRTRVALGAEVVVVPHHGSAGSSSPALVEAVGAGFALVSAGAHNRFGHPAPAVVQRWRAAGARVEGTAESGALFVRVDPAHGVQWLGGWRARDPRWWRER